MSRDFEAIVKAFHNPIHPYETYNELDDWHHFPLEDKTYPWGHHWKKLA